MIRQYWGGGAGDTQRQYWGGGGQYIIPKVSLAHSYDGDDLNHPAIQQERRQTRAFLYLSCC